MGANQAHLSRVCTKTTMMPSRANYEDQPYSIHRGPGTMPDTNAAILDHSIQKHISIGLMTATNATLLKPL